jgi:hypothetical protein
MNNLYNGVRREHAVYLHRAEQELVFQDASKNRMAGNRKDPAD